MASGRTTKNMEVAYGHRQFCHLAKTKFLIAIWANGRLVVCMVMVCTRGTMPKTAMRDSSRTFLSTAEVSRSLRMVIDMTATTRKARPMAMVSISGPMARTTRALSWQACDRESEFGLRSRKIGMKVRLF
jgi:hypothetical protein